MLGLVVWLLLGVAGWILWETWVIDLLLEDYHVPLYVPIEVLLFHPVLPFGHFLNDSTHVPNRSALLVLLLLLLVSLSIVRCKLLLGFDSELTP